MSGVYIVEFSIYPGIYKIGKSKDIESRIRQFQTSTILLGEVKLLYSKEFEDFSKAEKDIHELLKEYRVQDNREFFKGDLDLFTKTIEELNSDDYKVQIKETDSAIKEIRLVSFEEAEVAETIEEFLQYQEDYKNGIRYKDTSNYSEDDKIFFILNLLSVAATSINKLTDKVNKQEKRIEKLTEIILDS